MRITETTYWFDSIEEMQAFIQTDGPLKDGKVVMVAGVRFR